MRTIIEINLLPSEYAPVSSFNIRNALFLVFSVIILAFLALNTLEIIKSKDAFKKRNQQLSQETLRFSSFQKKIAKLKIRTTLLNKRRTQLLAVVNQRITWSDKLSQIYRLVPPEVWLSEISVSSETRRTPTSASQGEKYLVLHIKGESKGLTGVEKLIAGLEAVPFLEDPRFTSINQKELVGRLVMSFEIIAQVNTKGST